MAIVGFEVRIYVDLIVLGIYKAVQPCTIIDV